MTRVLFTGNSHLGAVRIGWDRIAARHPQIEAQFLGAPRETFDSFSRVGDQFGLFDTSAVRERLLAELKATMPALTVDLRAFDQVVLVGTHWGEIALLGLLQRCGIDGLRPVRPGMQGLSVPAFDAFCRDLAQGSGAAAQVARVGPGPVTLLPRPMRSEVMLTTDEGASHFGLAAHPDGMRAAVLRYQQIFAGVMAGAGASVVAQPAETLGEIGLTLNAWSVGPKSITAQGVAREVVDAVHMTGDYGVLILERLFADWAARGGA